MQSNRWNEIPVCPAWSAVCLCAQHLHAVAFLRKCRKSVSNQFECPRARAHPAIRRRTRHVLKHAPNTVRSTQQIERESRLRRDVPRRAEEARALRYTLFKVFRRHKLPRSDPPSTRRCGRPSGGGWGGAQSNESTTRIDVVCARKRKRRRIYGVVIECEAHQGGRC